MLHKLANLLSSIISGHTNFDKCNSSISTFKDCQSVPEPNSLFFGHKSGVLAAFNTRRLGLPRRLVEALFGP